MLKMPSLRLARVAEPELARRYSAALLAAATEKGIVDVVHKDVAAIGELWRKSDAEELRKSRGEILAIVVAADDLTDEQAENIKAALQPLCNGLKVLLEIHKDPSLFGGVIISIGTWFIDCSLNGKLLRAGELLTTIKESSILKRIASHHAVPHSFATNLAEKLMQEKSFNELTQKFLLLLSKKNRLALIPDIVVSFGDELRKIRGEVVARVITAEPLTEEQIENVKAALRPLSKGLNVLVETHEEPGLLGGVVISLGSWLIDCSVIGRLSRTGRSLAKMH